MLYQDETLWLRQKAMSMLFDVDIRTINEHLRNIYSQGEVDKDTTIRKSRIVQKEGNRNISREVFIYSLDAIISVGYRINSVRATQFRQWCTYIPRRFHSFSSSRFIRRFRHSVYNLFSYLSVLTTRKPTLA